MQDQVRRQLKRAVTQGENSRADAVKSRGKNQNPFLWGGGKPDIHAVEEAHDVEQRDEWNDTPGAFGENAIFAHAPARPLRFLPGADPSTKKRPPAPALRAIVH